MDLKQLPKKKKATHKPKPRPKAKSKPKPKAVAKKKAAPASTPANGNGQPASAAHISPENAALGRKIAELREKLDLNQGALGEKLKVSAMAISRWERGDCPPPGEALVALGFLAGPETGWTFWYPLGLTKPNVRKMLGMASE